MPLLPLRAPPLSDARALPCPALSGPRPRARYARQGPDAISIIHHRVSDGWSEGSLLIQVQPQCPGEGERKEMAASCASRPFVWHARVMSPPHVLRAAPLVRAHGISLEILIYG